MLRRGPCWWGQSGVTTPADRRHSAPITSRSRARIRVRRRAAASACSPRRVTASKRVTQVPALVEGGHGGRQHLAGVDRWSRVHAVKAGAHRQCTPPEILGARAQADTDDFYDTYRRLRPMVDRTCAWLRMSNRRQLRTGASNGTTIADRVSLRRSVSRTFARAHLQRHG